jgi:hypothetical protein
VAHGLLTPDKSREKDEMKNRRDSDLQILHDPLSLLKACQIFKKMAVGETLWLQASEVAVIDSLLLILPKGQYRITTHSARSCQEKLVITVEKRHEDPPESQSASGRSGCCNNN